MAKRIPKIVIESHRYKKDAEKAKRDYIAISKGKIKPEIKLERGWYNVYARIL